MTSINEKMGYKRPGRRKMMNLPKDRQAAVALTAARCPSCHATGVIENTIHGQRKRMCSRCSHSWVVA